MTKWFPFDYLLPLSVSGLLAILGFLLALVLLASVLRSDRPPQATMAWLLAIVLVPYLGVPLYLLVGGRKMRRMAGRKGPVYDRNVAVPGGEFGAGTERVLRSFGVPPATRGNRVELVTESVDAYEQLLRIIDGAEKTLFITTYLLGRDAVGAAVVARLARRAAEGVEVRVLLDALGSWWVGRRWFAPLTDVGGRVAYFMPMLHIPFRGRNNLRNHRKIIVADARIALTGGMNIAEAYMGPEPSPGRWRDVSLIVEGPAALDLDTLFRSDWAFATRSAQDAEPSLPAQPAATLSGDTPVQVVASGPDVEGDPLYESLISLLFAAQRRIWVVTPYFVPDEILVRALELAARRGVDVRLLIPSRSNHLTADLARVGYLRQVANAGGMILRFRPVMLHAKLILLDDDLAVVGSANMDMRSLFLNYEVALFLYSPERVGEADAWFRTLIPHCRTGLTRPNFAQELAENVVRLLSPLL